MSEANQIDSIVNAVVNKWGKVDILINNAGLMPLSYLKSGGTDG